MLQLKILFVLTLLPCLALGQACMPQEYNLYFTNQAINFTTPNYPQAYRPGSSCRYRIVAPPNHVVTLNCLYEVFPNTCGTEFLYISRDGDLQFRDAETYCRAGYVARTSHYRAIAFAYFSTNAATQQRGRLHCHAVARRLERCDCGWSLGTRIANGQEAAKHEFTAMVALRDITSNQRVFCGGTIVSPRYILTAAHCTREHPIANRIIAYAGDHDLSSSTESIFAVQYPIQEIINHPGYTVSESGDLNDIALLLTTRTIEWSRGVGPMCLPVREASDSFIYRNVDLVGWGTLGFAAAKSNTLQKITLLTMDNRQCQSQYNGSRIVETHLCTYDYRGLGQDSCQYDSGGPVILRQQRMYIIGIVSFGRACGQRYGIGVNTRITAHLNWMWRYIGGSVCVI